MIISIFILALAISSKSSDCSSNDQAIQIVERNRGVILRELGNWNPGLAYNTTKNNLIKTFSSISSISNCNEKEVFVKLYLSNRIDLFKMLGGATVINDTINLEIMLNLLRSNDKDVALNAWDDLYNRSSIALLRTRSDKVKNIIAISGLSEDRKNSLLSLVNLTEKEKSTVISTAQMLPEKAAAGDTAALDSLIGLYKNTTNISEKTLYTILLMRTGRTEAVKAVLEDFSKPIFHVGSYACTTSLYQRDIVRNLRRYHPDEELLKERASDVITILNPYTQENQEMILAWWRDFKEWTWKNYQVKIDERPPFIGVMNDCQR